MLRNLAFVITLALFSANVVAETKEIPAEDLLFNTLYDPASLYAGHALQTMPEACTPTHKDAACQKRREEITSYFLANLPQEDGIDREAAQDCWNPEATEKPACHKTQAQFDTLTQDYLTAKAEASNPINTFYPFVRNTMAEVFADSLKPTLSFGKECTAECQAAAAYFRGYFTAYMYAALAGDDAEKRKQFQHCITKAEDSPACDPVFAKARTLTQRFNQLLLTRH